MRFNGICLVTREVLQLRSFYTAILQVEAEGDDTFTTLSTRGAALSIFTEEGMEHMAPGSMEDSGCGRYTLEFEVEDVDREFERLKALEVIFVKPPTTQTWVDVPFGSVTRMGTSSTSLPVWIPDLRDPQPTALLYR